jgi:hypothetical protein
VPLTAPAAPQRWLDLLYSVALRQRMQGHACRAQHNPRSVGVDTAETTFIHGLEALISRLTLVNIQGTITPDAACHTPWHYHYMLGVKATPQTLMGTVEHMV